MIKAECSFEYNQVGHTILFFRKAREERHEVRLAKLSGF
jgi:hypothetical protein